MPTETSIEYVNLFDVYFSEKKYDLSKIYLIPHFLLLMWMHFNTRSAANIFSDYYKWYIAKGDSSFLGAIIRMISRKIHFSIIWKKLKIGKSECAIKRSWEAKKKSIPLTKKIKKNADSYFGSREYWPF